MAKVVMALAPPERLEVLRAALAAFGAGQMTVTAVQQARARAGLVEGTVWLVHARAAADIRTGAHQVRAL